MNCLFCGKEFIKIGHNQRYCSKECFDLSRIEYRRSNKRRKYDKDYRYNVKIKVIEHYSNGTMQCNCCGEKHIEFLSIDHIDCGRLIYGKNKRPNKYYSLQLCLNLIKNNFPEGYQVLCFNCNCAKGSFGECPHEIERSNKIV